MSEPFTIEVIKLLDQSLSIKCPGGKQAELQQAASYVENLLQQQQVQSIFGNEKALLLIALQLSHELLAIKAFQEDCVNDMDKRLRSLGKHFAEKLAVTE